MNPTIAANGSTGESTLFGVFDRRKKELQRTGDTDALEYLEQYTIMLKASRSPDTWENFLHFFGNSFAPSDWADVAKAYDDFMRGRFGIDTRGRAHGMWVGRECSTYDDSVKTPEGAIFFNFVGNYIRSLN